MPIRSGVALGLGAYFLWGLLPLYLRLMREVPPAEILAHRILWSVLLLAVIATVLRRWTGIGAALREGRTALMLCGSAALISINWMLYIWSVLNGHVLESSLGYFMNPLVNVALGMLVLGERLTRIQAIAVALAAVGVAALAASGGGAIWIPLVLAVSFGSYGLLRKVAPIDALGGLLAETAILAPLALAALLLATADGGGAFGRSTSIDLLLVMAGPVTAVPLLLFAAAAKRMPYSTLGLLQYIAPTLQFLQAILLFHEPFRPIHAFTFGCIWLGCGLFAIESLKLARVPRPVID